MTLRWGYLLKIATAIAVLAIQHFVKAIITISGRGIITLPAKLRRAMRWEADDQLIAEITPKDYYCDQP